MTMTTPHNAALGRALDLFDHPVRKSAFGDVEGVDVLSIALDRMTEALAALADCPRSSETTLEEVMARMAPGGVLDSETSACLLHVREGIKRATYAGVTPGEIRELDDARADLHERLKTLIATRGRKGRDD
jgi:hypothetical protein